MPDYAASTQIEIVSIISTVNSSGLITDVTVTTNLHAPSGNIYSDQVDLGTPPGYVQTATQAAVTDTITNAEATMAGDFATGTTFTVQSITTWLGGYSAVQQTVVLLITFPDNKTRIVNQAVTPDTTQQAAIAAGTNWTIAQVANYYALGQVYGGPITFIQQVGGGSTLYGQSYFTSAAANFTPGNLLIAVVNWSYSGSSGASVSIATPSGWTDSGAGTVNNGAPNGALTVSYMPNNPGGSQSWEWVATPSGEANLGAWAYTIFEFSGVPAASPLDLAVVSNHTSTTSSTTLDTTAASGTTQSGDLVLHAAGIDRIVPGTLTSSMSSVPTSGWTIATKYGSTSESLNAFVCAQYQVLDGTATNPRGIMTSSITESSESVLLTFKGSPVTFLAASGASISRYVGTA